MNHNAPSRRSVDSTSEDSRYGRSRAFATASRIANASKATFNKVSYNCERLQTKTDQTTPERYTFCRIAHNKTCIQKRYILRGIYMCVKNTMSIRRCYHQIKLCPDVRKSARIPRTARITPGTYAENKATRIAIIAPFRLSQSW